MQTRIVRCRMWHDQCGSQGLQAAAAALAAALIIVALFGSVDVVGPAVERAYNCAAAVLTGGGGCANAGTPPAGSPPATSPQEKPWWERAWDGIRGGWDWFTDNVLKPAGDWLKGAWDWLWEEHEWTWWKDTLAWLKDQGPLGFLAAGILGFAADLLFGIGMDGKFRWGMVIFATATTILSFFGVGLLAKIPVIGKLFVGGGAAARLLGWIGKLPFVQRLVRSRFGQWIIKLGTEGIADLLQGKIGTWLIHLGRGLGRLPIIGPILLAIKDSKVIKTIGNYIWTYIVRGPVGLVGDVIKTIVKDILAPKPGTPLEKIVTIFKRLFIWKGLRDIIKWLLRPTLPFP